jgi:hypothetical protein
LETLALDPDLEEGAGAITLVATVTTGATLVDLAGLGDTTGLRVSFATVF